MEIYGTRGKALILLQSYLHYLQQHVHINCYSSTTKPIISGVPQGSTLGLFLFNLFIKYVVNVNREVKFANYADETSISSFGNGDEAVDMANQTSDRILSWSDSNLLKPNNTKTKANSFRPKNKHIVLSKT